MWFLPTSESLRTAKGSDKETHSKECEEGWAGQGEASGEHLPSPSGQGELWSKGHQRH